MIQRVSFLSILQNWAWKLDHERSQLNVKVLRTRQAALSLRLKIIFCREASLALKISYRFCRTTKESSDKNTKQQKRLSTRKVSEITEQTQRVNYYYFPHHFSSINFNQNHFSTSAAERWANRQKRNNSGLVAV